MIGWDCVHVHTSHSILPCSAVTHTHFPTTLTTLATPASMPAPDSHPCRLVPSCKLPPQQHLQHGQCSCTIVWQLSWGTCMHDSPLGWGGHQLNISIYFPSIPMLMEFARTRKGKHSNILRGGHPDSSVPVRDGGWARTHLGP